MGKVIDIFRCAGKVNKFTNGFQFLITVNLLFQEVLHRFHIVIGGSLNILYSLSIFIGKVFGNTIENIICVSTQRRHLFNI